MLEICPKITRGRQGSLWLDDGDAVFIILVFLILYKLATFHNKRILCTNLPYWLHTLKPHSRHGGLFYTSWSVGFWNKLWKLSIMLSSKIGNGDTFAGPLAPPPCGWQHWWVKTWPGWMCEPRVWWAQSGGEGRACAQLWVGLFMTIVNEHIKFQGLTKQQGRNLLSRSLHSRDDKGSAHDANKQDSS